jgi:hypothetical protein
LEVNIYQTDYDSKPNFVIEWVFEPGTFSLSSAFI